ncbi:MAG: hypothetical protein AB1420_08075 [Bacillota bacterium]
MVKLRNTYGFKGLIKVLTIVFVLSIAVTVFALPALSAAKNYETNYLENRFQASIPETLTKGEFIRLLATFLNLNYTGDENYFSDIDAASKYYKSAMALYEQGVLKETKLEPEKTLHFMEAVSLAVNAARMGELAQTFPEWKVSLALKKMDLTYSITSSIIPFDKAREAAVAVNLGILPQELFEDFKLNSVVNRNQAAILLTRVMAVRGQYKNYLGTVVEDGIYGKINNAYLNSKKVNNEELLTVLDMGVKQGLMTGYNLRDIRNNSNFDENLTIRYGHQNIIHAQQLIGLLRSEGLNAKVQLEPKTSAYVYLKEWGMPGPDSDLELVPQEDGNYIARAKEYDLCLEFASVKQKEMFNSIILKYAKVNERNQKGLIYQSWWQPLYASLTEMENYQTVTEVIVSKGDYEAHIYSLNEKAEDLVEGLKKLDDNIKTTTLIVWVNQAFYDYLQGEYK